MCVKSKYLLTNAGTVKFRGGAGGAWHAAAVRLYFHKLISFAIPTAKGLSILFFSCLSSSSGSATSSHSHSYSYSSSHSYSSSSSSPSSFYSSSCSARFPFSVCCFFFSPVCLIVALNLPRLSIKCQQRCEVSLCSLCHHSRVVHKLGVAPLQVLGRLINSV